MIRMVSFALPLVAMFTMADIASAQAKRGQDQDKQSSRSSSISISRSTDKNGSKKKSNYSKETRNGRVVKESGDRNLLRDFKEFERLLEGFDHDFDLRSLEDWVKDQQKQLERAALDAASDSDSSTSSSTSTKTRRVVVENGQVVVDESTEDGKPVRQAGKGKKSPRMAKPQKKPRRLPSRSSKKPSGPSDKEMEKILRQFPEFDQFLRHRGAGSDLGPKGPKQNPGRKSNRPKGGKTRTKKA